MEFLQINRFTGRWLVRVRRYETSKNKNQLVDFKYNKKYDGPYINKLKVVIDEKWSTLVRVRDRGKAEKCVLMSLV